MNSTRKLGAALILMIAFMGGSAFRDCGEIPELNQAIVSYVQQNMGNKVGRGECWDLAAGALNTTGAKWDRYYGFGKVIDYKTECVFPGDIIQFEKVSIKFVVGRTTHTKKMDKHTAIVTKVNQSGSFEVAEQNTSEAGRKVTTDTFDPATVHKGKFTFYRPLR